MVREWEKERTTDNGEKSATGYEGGSNFHCFSMSRSAASTVHVGGERTLWCETGSLRRFIDILWSDLWIKFEPP
jgi:hypothetical protein